MDEEGRAWVLSGSLHDSLHPHLLRQDGAARRRWYDELPPRVVATSPAEGATDVSSRRILIGFDEFIVLQNATENVVVSPPQLEAPVIKAQGKRISVQLQDSLIPNTTYTIDFSDAISDNNEGNPMGNYTYTFSTGQEIDTLEIAGYVLNAKDLEPVKGILVGLYANLHDTAFATLPMQRVARTDSRGHFCIKGVKAGDYRVYALRDQNNDYRFSQKSEEMAFTPEIFTPLVETRHPSGHNLARLAPHRPHHHNGLYPLPARRRRAPCLY